MTTGSASDTTKQSRSPARTIAMTTPPSACPHCGSPEIHQRKTRGDWICDLCDHAWVPAADTDTGAAPAARTRLFLSYGRKDAAALADRLRADLEARGFEVWQDSR